MIIPFLAEVAQASPDALFWGVLVVGGSALLQMLLSVSQVVRLFSGKGGERQIEPTSLHSIQGKLDELAEKLGDMDREMGETSEAVRQLKESISSLGEEQREEIRRTHSRIDRLSEDLARRSGELDAMRGAMKC